MNLNGNILLGVLLSEVTSSVELLPRGARGRGKGQPEKVNWPAQGQTALFATPCASCSHSGPLEGQILYKGFGCQPKL